MEQESTWCGRSVRLVWDQYVRHSNLNQVFWGQGSRKGAGKGRQALDAREGGGLYLEFEGWGFKE